MPVLSIEFTNLRETIKALELLAGDFSDMKPELMAAAKEQAKRTSRLFRDGGDPEWEDIGYWTRKARKSNQDGRPLTEWGRLRQSVVALKEGVAGSAFSYSKNHLTIGSTEERASALQSSRRMIKLRDAAGRWDGQTWRKMADRPFLYFDNEIAALAQKAAHDSVEQRVKRRLKQ